MRLELAVERGQVRTAGQTARDDGFEHRHILAELPPAAPLLRAAASDRGSEIGPDRGPTSVQSGRCQRAVHGDPV
jgi:hypothetical protein